MDSLQRVGPLIGRLLIASIFIFSGLHKVMDFSSTVGMLESKGMPMPAVAAAIATGVELVGGIMLAIGWKARGAAIALALFTLAAGLMFHNFWAASGAEMQNQMAHFMKNIAMIGGLLYVVVHGSGAYSVERQLGTERRHSLADRRLSMTGSYRFAK